MIKPENILSVSKWIGHHDCEDLFFAVYGHKPEPNYWIRTTTYVDDLGEIKFVPEIMLENPVDVAK